MGHWDAGERRTTEPKVGCGTMTPAGPRTRKGIPR
jgi:hypothetical protein